MLVACILNRSLLKPDKIKKYLSRYTFNQNDDTFNHLSKNAIPNNLLYLITLICKDIFIVIYC